MKKEYLLEEIYKAVAQENNKLVHIWFTKIVFSWRWWLGIALAIIPWIVWIKIRDKNNTAKLLFVGLVVAIISNFLDIIGGCFFLWYYEWKDFPYLPIYFPWDFTLFPISVMIMLQFKPNLNKYIKSVIFTFLCAFIFEPLFSYLGIYRIMHWKYWYSFIIYIPLYLFYNYIYKSKMWQSQSNS